MVLQRFHLIHVYFSLLKNFDLFKTDEEQEAFMEDHDFANAHASFLERRRRYADAADKLRQEGHMLRAIRLLLKDSFDENSMKKATAFLLESLWSYLSFGIQPNLVSPEESSELNELFELSKQFRLGDLDPKVRKEVSLFVDRTRNVLFKTELMHLSLRCSQPSILLTWRHSGSLDTRFALREGIMPSRCSALITSLMMRFHN
jgi:hypothetical protein